MRNDIRSSRPNAAKILIQMERAEVKTPVEWAHTTQDICQFPEIWVSSPGRSHLVSLSASESLRAPTRQGQRMELRDVNLSNSSSPLIRLYQWHGLNSVISCKVVRLPVALAPSVLEYSSNALKAATHRSADFQVM